MIYKDQMNRTVVLEKTPKRIISLVPSQTELLYDLGLEDEVVGITKFCIFPERWFKTKTRIGGTKNVNLEKVKALKPDLIIGNKEENSQEDILALEKIAPVWMSDIYTLEDAYEMMLEIGKICQLETKAKELVERIKQNFKTQFTALDKNKTAIYLIWNEPLMACGKHTFIDDLLNRFGLKNYYAEEERYPLCVPENIDKVDYILLSSEPFPFNESHKKVMETKFPNSKIIFVSGEMFSWYGSHLEKVPNYFSELKSEFD